MPTPEAGPRKEHTWMEKMSIAALDMGRDIVTANRMAKDKFDGNSALMQAAKGATTTLVGVGLEKAMEEYFEGVMKGQEPLVSRTPSKFGEGFRSVLSSLEKTSPRLHHFFVQSAKDLVVGGAYNGLAFFTRPLLESAKAEHLVGSLAVNASEAFLTKGFETPKQRADALQHRADLLKAKQTAKDVIAESLKIQTDESVLKKSYAFFEIGKINQDLRTLTIPEDTTLPWQNFLRQYTAFSNPATLLGLSMVGESAMALKENFQAVRKIRKEKGIRGKSVDMPKKGGWQDRGDRGGYRNQGNDRREQHKWQDKKDTVYYGRSNTVVSREEEDRAKSF